MTSSWSVLNSVKSRSTLNDAQMALVEVGLGGGGPAKSLTLQFVRLATGGYGFLCIDSQAVGSEAVGQFTLLILQGILQPLADPKVSASVSLVSVSTHHVYHIEHHCVSLFMRHYWRRDSVSTAGLHRTADNHLGC